MTFTTDTYDTGYAKSRERFERDTAKHEMTVLRDDGLYRHIRFMRPGDSFYLYDLVTWPGYLAIVGDCEDYVFCRLTDMFEFFAGSRQADGINPSYWSEKLRCGRGRDLARTYSEDMLRSHVIEWFESETGPIDPEAFAREDYFTSLDLTLGQRISLSRALEADVLEDWEGGGEQGAHGRLRDFEWFYDGRESWDYHERGTPSVTISDSWEWDLRDFDGHFLWACWAIRRGIERYRAATSAEVAA
jgi:hypothetical protein